MQVVGEVLPLEKDVKPHLQREHAGAGFAVRFRDVTPLLQGTYSMYSKRLGFQLGLSFWIALAVVPSSWARAVTFATSCTDDG